MSSMMATPPMRVWRRSAETKALGSERCVSRNRAYTTSNNAWGSHFGDVLHLEHDIRQTESMRFPTSDGRLDLIEVDTHRSARRPSRPSEFEGHITAAAPNIEACRTGRYANLSQQRTCGRTHHLG